MFCLRLSVLVLYLRVFGASANFRHVVYFIITIQTLFYLTSTSVTIGLLILCIAQSESTHAFCTQTYKLVVVQRVFGIIVDFLMVEMPLKILWNLQLSVRKKIAVNALFMTGLM